MEKEKIPRLEVYARHIPAAEWPTFCARMIQRCGLSYDALYNRRIGRTELKESENAVARMICAEMNIIVPEE